MTNSRVTEQKQMAELDWSRIAADLDSHGCAILTGVLSGEECSAIARSYSEPELFRSRVVMARHGFGRGEYQYFAYPLPSPVANLRAALYPPLAEIANRCLYHPAPLWRKLQHLPEHLSCLLLLLGSQMLPRVHAIKDLNLPLWRET